MEVPTPIHSKDLDVPNATVSCPELTVFACLAQLGLEAIGQRLEPDWAVLACRLVAPGGWCSQSDGHLMRAVAGATKLFGTSPRNAGR